MYLTFWLRRTALVFLQVRFESKWPALQCCSIFLPVGSALALWELWGRCRGGLRVLRLRLAPRSHVAPFCGRAGVSQCYMDGCKGIPQITQIILFVLLNLDVSDAMDRRFEGLGSCSCGVLSRSSERVLLNDKLPLTCSECKDKVGVLRMELNEFAFLLERLETLSLGLGPLQPKPNMALIY